MKSILNSSTPYPDSKTFNQRTSDGFDFGLFKDLFFLKVRKSYFVHLSLIDSFQSTKYSYLVTIESNPYIFKKKGLNPILDLFASRFYDKSENGDIRSDIFSYQLNEQSVTMCQRQSDQSSKKASYFKNKIDKLNECKYFFSIIYSLQREGSITIVRLKDGSIINFYETLSYFENHIHFPNSLVRIRRECIINLRYVSSFETNYESKYKSGVLTLFGEKYVVSRRLFTKVRNNILEFSIPK